MDDLAAMIENGRLEPGAATDIAGGPNDRPDALAPQIERRRTAGGPNGNPRCRIGGRRLESLVVDVSVDPLEDAQHARMRSLRGPIEVAGERGLCAIDGREPADQPHAEAGQNAEIEVAVVGAADQLQRRLTAGRLEIAPFEGRIVQNAGLLHPGVDVPSAIAAGHAGVIPDGERHRPPRGMDLLGELSAGRRGADHQHAGFRKLPRLPVVCRRHLEYRG